MKTCNSLLEWLPVFIASRSSCDTARVVNKQLKVFILTEQHRMYVIKSCAVIVKYVNPILQVCFCVWTLLLWQGRQVSFEDDTKQMSKRAVLKLQHELDVRYDLSCSYCCFNAFKNLHVCRVLPAIKRCCFSQDCSRFRTNVNEVVEMFPAGAASRARSPWLGSWKAEGNLSAIELRRTGRSWPAEKKR